MKVKEVIDLMSYGTHWQLIGAMTGKKLCNSYSSENLKSKYMDCSVCDAPIFASFNIHNSPISKMGESMSPMICIWVSGQ